MRHRHDQQKAGAARERRGEAGAARELPARLGRPQHAGRREHEEHGLAVDRLPVEGRREDREVQAGAVGHARAEAGRDQAVEKVDRCEVAGKRHHDAGDHEVVVEDDPHPAHHQRVEREEGDTAVVAGVAVGGDLHEPHAVPHGPGVADVGKEAVERLGEARQSLRPGRRLDAEYPGRKGGHHADQQPRDDRHDHGAPQQARRRRLGGVARDARGFWGRLEDLLEMGVRGRVRALSRGAGVDRPDAA